MRSMVEARAGVDPLRLASLDTSPACGGATNLGQPVAIRLVLIHKL